ESALPGISHDCIPAPEEATGDLPPPGQYCHISMVKNPLVIDRIVHYLTAPDP
ncbi:MAG: acetyltransferase, partial [Methanomicrobiales archaeon]|nr:acetyltransferase [Methanomicrobiales archaeon]